MHRDGHAHRLAHLGRYDQIPQSAERGSERGWPDNPRHSVAGIVVTTFRAEPITAPLMRTQHHHWGGVMALP